MTKGLKRYYGANHLHFITFSCYRRQPLLSTARRRDCFLNVLEQVRQKHNFLVVGYVVMPEHVHLLVSESKTAQSFCGHKIFEATSGSAIIKEPAPPARSTEILRAAGTFLAEAVLRFQCIYPAEAGGKIKIHASQPSEARTGISARTMDLEQLQFLLFG